MGFPDIQDMTSDETAASRVKMIQEAELVVCVALDSGADVSVAPLSHGQLGMPGHDGLVHMVDAQGGKTASSGNRRFRLTATPKQGNEVNFIETFAIGKVSQPLPSLGKMLRQGWRIGGSSHGFLLQHAATRCGRCWRGQRPRE